MTTETDSAQAQTETETAFIGATTDGLVVAFSRGGYSSGRPNITRPTTPQAAALWDAAIAEFHVASNRAYAEERAARAARRDKRAAAKARDAAVAAACKHATDVLIYASFVRV